VPIPAYSALFDDKSFKKALVFRTILRKMLCASLTSVLDVISAQCRLTLFYRLTACFIACGSNAHTITNNKIAKAVTLLYPYES
jgi:hypothetical protein